MPAQTCRTRPERRPPRSPKVVVPATVSETVPVSLEISVGADRRRERRRAPPRPRATDRGGCRWRSLTAVGLGLRVGYLYLYRHHVQAVRRRPLLPPASRTYLASGKGFIDPYSLYYGAAQVIARGQPPASVDARPRHRPPRSGVTSFFGQLLYSAVLGAASVALVGMAAREVGGRRVGLIAAGITALYPVFLIDDGSLLAETVRGPARGPGGVGLLPALAPALDPESGPARCVCPSCARSTRSELVLLVVFLAAPAGLLCRGLAWRKRLGLCAARR